MTTERSARTSMTIELARSSAREACRRRVGGTASAAGPCMTVKLPIRARAIPFRIEHEDVCRRCGHGESLHPQRDLACVVCDERAQLGIPSQFCVGFVSDRREASRSAASVH